MSEQRLREALRRAKVDAAFRKALMDGVPVLIRPKMKEALAAIPDWNAASHSQRYFGDQLPVIVERIAPLLQELNRYLSESRNLAGLFDWLDATGFGSHYAMIKAFDAWAQLKLEPTKH